MKDFFLQRRYGMVDIMLLILVQGLMLSDTIGFVWFILGVLLVFLVVPKFTYAPEVTHED